MLRLNTLLFNRTDSMPQRTAQQASHSAKGKDRALVALEDVAAPLLLIPAHALALRTGDGTLAFAHPAGSTTLHGCSLMVRVEGPSHVGSGSCVQCLHVDCSLEVTRNPSRSPRHLKQRGAGVLKVTALTLSGAGGAHAGLCVNPEATRMCVASEANGVRSQTQAM